MQNKRKTVELLVANAILLAMEIVALVLSIFEHGVELFKFYTQLSNIFALCASAITVVVCVLSLAKNASLPKWLNMINYMASCCLSVTFTVVVTVLAPGAAGEYGLWEMYVYLLFSGSMLFTHTLCPLVCMFSFVFLQPKANVGIKNTLCAFIPTVSYAVVALLLNLLKVMEGPYDFLLVYKNPWYVSVVAGVVLLSLAFGLAWLLGFGNKKAHRG